MSKEEALKKWKEEVDFWKRKDKLGHVELVDYTLMTDFVKILDALIAPEESKQANTLSDHLKWSDPTTHTQKEPENRHVPETCTEKVEKSTDQSNQKTRSESLRLFPPPWNILENTQKTEGWYIFQIEMQKKPDYYLADPQIPRWISFDEEDIDPNEHYIIMASEDEIFYYNYRYKPEFAKWWLKFKLPLLPDNSADDLMLNIMNTKCDNVQNPEHKDDGWKPWPPENIELVTDINGKLWWRKNA